jgi:LPXTG-motif cell wall-anchored protein
MYISAAGAMQRRERIEDPYGNIPTMQEPGLGRMGWLAMYLPSTAAMYRREHIASPVCAVDTMQQPGLGDLSSGTVSIAGQQVSLPLLAGAVALLLLAGYLVIRKRRGRSKPSRGAIARRTTTTFAT